MPPRCFRRTVVRTNLFTVNGWKFWVIEGRADFRVSNLFLCRVARYLASLFMWSLGKRIDRCLRPRTWERQPAGRAAIFGKFLPSSTVFVSTNWPTITVQQVSLLTCGTARNCVERSNETVIPYLADYFARSAIHVNVDPEWLYGLKTCAMWHIIQRHSLVWI